MSQNVQLIIIDPQRDFCDPNRALYVPGAQEDMNHLAALVMRLKDKVTDIHTTLDSHRMLDISHHIWWRNTAGAHASHLRKSLRRICALELGNHPSKRV